MMDFLFYLTIGLFILVCLFMILLILIQKGRGGGLASAFGGAGGNTAFGSKTGDVLTWATSVVFGIFLVLAVALNLFANARNAAGTATAANTSAESAPGPGPLNIPTTPDPILGEGRPPVSQPAAAPTGPTSLTAPQPATVPALSPATAPAPASGSAPTSGPASAPATGQAATPAPAPAPTAAPAGQP